MNNNYGGFWYNESDNSITFSTLTVSTSGGRDLIYPNLHKVDLGTNVSKIIFPAADTDLSEMLLPEGFYFGRHDKPVMSYNGDTKMYNVSFLSFGLDTGVRLHSFDIIETSKYECDLYGVPAINILGMDITTPAPTTPPPTTPPPTTPAP